MGKLHTLRRAIERNPDIWTPPFVCPLSLVMEGNCKGYRVHGAVLTGDGWRTSYVRSYQDFVAYTLREYFKARLTGVGTEAGEARTSAPSGSC